MKYIEEYGNLFEVPTSYALAQCISLDCAMGAGIAREFVNRYPNMREYCKRVICNNHLSVPCIIPYISDGRVIFNLVTKQIRWHKPTYETICSCIDDMIYLCEEQFHIKKLALPQIGCGLDKLDWGIISRYIKSEYKDKDIEILVRIKEG